MRARLVNINEEIVGNFKSWNNNAIMYKNPPSIRRLAESCRAIVDMKGNLYIAELGEGEGNEDERYSFPADVAHVDMIDYLCKIGELKGNHNVYELRSESRGWIAYKNLSAWQRLDDTNDFYLAESYSRIYLSDLNNVNEIKRCMGNTNRSDINFIYKSIRTETDNYVYGE